MHSCYEARPAAGYFGWRQIRAAEIFSDQPRIISKIQGGYLPPGSPLPSKNEIIERHRVSNTTARKALHELGKEGGVNRVKGKGTFVRDFTVVRWMSGQTAELENLMYPTTAINCRIVLSFLRINGVLG